MQLYYGIEKNKINITKQALDNCIFSDILFIPSSLRVRLFGDPIIGTHKFIFLYDSSNNLIKYDDLTDVVFNIKKCTDLITGISIVDYKDKLESLHQSLKINHGSFKEEYPEQLMVARFLKGDEKVLELGANIGRNTLVIASLLNNQKNLVTLECDPNTVVQLTENRDINSMQFNIEGSALSKRPLIQRGWNTIVSDTVPDGYSKVNTIDFDTLEAKYQIKFNTIVADCEGALYYIFMDMPEMLTNIKTVIMENDYHNLNHKNAVDCILTDKGFQRVYSEAGGWGPCHDKFFEVWQIVLV
jgi:FkbM family methyltransferase